MHSFTTKSLSGTLFLFVLLLSACGGGGGSSANGTAPGANSVAAAIQSSAPLSSCPNGGISVDTGIDINGNGILDPSEVTSTQYVCNGASGLNALVAITAEPAGTNCATGGQKIVSWLDANANGVLDPSETTSATTSYVCNGTGTGPSINGVFPSSAFAGRTADIEISGDETSWDATAVVNLGAGITVQSVIVASPTALRVTASVDPGAALGNRAVTVTQGTQVLTLANLFRVAAPLTTVSPINVKQGGSFQSRFSLADFSALLDSTLAGGGVYPNLAIASPTNGLCNITNATPYWVDLNCYMDVLATPGPVTVDIRSGPPSGIPVPFVDPNDVSIIARAPVSVADGATASMPVADALENALFSYQPVVNPAIQSFTLTGPTNGTIDVPASGRIADYTGTSNSTTPVILTSDTTTHYLVVTASGAGTVGITRTELAPNTATETEPNDTVPTAQGITLPAVVTSSLAAATDVDYFIFTAAPADVGKTVRVVTLPGDTLTDTLVEVLTGNGATSLGLSTDMSYHEDLTSSPIPSAGTYIVKVTAGTMYDPAHANYKLVVLLQ
jgi:hypothetical protein